MNKQMQVLRVVLGASMLLALVVLVLSPVSADVKSAEDWSELFNGKDLSGWDTWLGVPDGAKEPTGLNKDPLKVYSVVEVDGKPAIRITGEVFGALTSKQEFENYHLRLEFKWGEKKYPPRLKDRRDSGLLYHCVGEQGVAGGARKAWMQSIECQIMEEDCGDFYSVGGTGVPGPLVDVEGVRQNEKGPVLYKKGAPKIIGVRSRIVRDVNHEKPLGQWNTIELLSVGGTSVHIVNGKANLVLTNARRKVGDKEEPLTRGKIQLQSEAAEVYYRNIAVKPLRQIPSEYSR